jgi:hypothetical protein
MSQLLTTTTRPPAFRDRSVDDTDRAARDREARRSRLWTVLEALAYAGAYIDPSGILAVERLRRAVEDEEEARHGR